MKRFTFEIVSKLFLKIKLILQNIHVKKQMAVLSQVNVTEIESNKTYRKNSDELENYNLFYL